MLEHLRPAAHAAIAEQYALSRALPGAERGINHAVAAATEAASQHGYEQAARLLEVALGLAGDDPGSRQELLPALAVAQARAWDFGRAPATTLRAIELLDPAQGAELVVHVAEALRDGAPPSSWEPLVERGLELAGHHRDTTWARLVVSLDPIETVGESWLRVGRWRGYPVEAIGVLRGSGREEDEARAIEPFRPRSVGETASLLERSRGWSNPRARMRVLDLAGRDFSLRHGRTVDAIACYRELLELGSQVGSLPAQAEGCGQLALCLALIGEAAEARDYLARGADLVEDLWQGHRSHMLLTLSSSAVVGYLAGRSRLGRHR